MKNQIKTSRMISEKERAGCMISEKNKTSHNISNKAICEISGQKILLSEGFFIADPRTSEWSFVCKNAPEIFAEYWIPVTELIKSPEAFVDWIAHLNEKTWFNAKKFTDFFTRLRKKNRIYNAL